MVAILEQLHEESDSPRQRQKKLDIEQCRYKHRTIIHTGRIVALEILVNKTFVYESIKGCISC